MTEPQTDVEKIEWLWSRLDTLNSQLAAAQNTARELEDKCQRLSTELERVWLKAIEEANQARQAAADAVRDYVSATKS